ncbi:DUF4231 domain-containing protein [Echinicola sp. 20G]|uniref:DUF4231 domain-containing protein n=1 Tax=Echinicola sp. 20G TaxID=2781961 RepID=UPI001F182F7B|nr:DUF4231 domain-containing protein [Echinicola sp. 20G]
MTPEEYIEERVDFQMDWYERKALHNKNLFIWKEGLTIVFAALIPFFAGLDSDGKILPLTIAVLGVLVTVLTGLASILKLEKKWIEYRTTAEMLKHEKYLFLTNADPYSDPTSSYPNFVSKIESLISKENTTWNNYIKNNNVTPPTSPKP